MKRITGRLLKDIISLIWRPVKYTCTKVAGKYHNIR